MAAGPPAVGVRYGLEIIAAFSNTRTGQQD